MSNEIHHSVVSTPVLTYGLDHVHVQCSIEMADYRIIGDTATTQDLNTHNPGNTITSM